jgi:hypothetical protein
MKEKTQNCTICREMPLASIRLPSTSTRIPKYTSKHVHIRTKQCESVDHVIMPRSFFFFKSQRLHWDTMSAYVHATCRQCMNA